MPLTHTHTHTNSFIYTWIHSPAFSTILHYFCGYFCCLLLLSFACFGHSSLARRGSLSFRRCCCCFVVKVIVVGGALESTRIVPNIYCQIMIIAKVKWPDSSCPTRIRFDCSVLKSKSKTKTKRNRNRNWKASNVFRKFHLTVFFQTLLSHTFAICFASFLLEFQKKIESEKCSYFILILFCLFSLIVPQFSADFLHLLLFCFWISIFDLILCVFALLPFAFASACCHVRCSSANKAGWRCGRNWYTLSRPNASGAASVAARFDVVTNVDCTLVSCCLADVALSFFGLGAQRFRDAC